MIRFQSLICEYAEEKQGFNFINSLEKDMLKPVPVESLSTQFYELWSKNWFLLSAGDFAANQFNAMTISWGMLGSLWEKPAAQVFVRHTRYTFEFMEKYDNFTICAFPVQYRKSLSLLGSQSGRDGNKISVSGLTPLASQCISAPSYAEANLVLECKKMYWADFDPDHFLDDEIQSHYPLKDYHRIYIGEVLTALQAAD
jgi:flavin reductase (DIM6/NTAB) family NADH-FMN oxidoreductase RutF